jgi:hypothetical protein
MNKKIGIAFIFWLILPQLKIFPQLQNKLTHENMPFLENINFHNSVQRQYHYGNPDSFRNSETLGEEWDGAAWVSDKNFVYSYDAINNLTNYKTQHWTGSEWTDTLLTTHSYDNNLETAVSYQFWNGWQWLNDSRYLYTYDSYGYTHISLYQNGDSLDWTNNSRSINYRDNATHHIDSLTYQVWNTSVWEDYIKEFHYYNSQLKDSLIIDYMWKDNGWVNFGKYIFINDPSTSSYTLSYLRWTGTEWTNHYQYLNFYDSKDNYLGYTYQIWESGEWKNKYRYLYEYDQNNKNTIIWYQVYTAGYGWEIVTESDIEYNTDSLMSLKTDISWEGSVSTNSYRWTYKYDVIPVSAIHEIADEFLFLGIYPNPFNQSTKIMYSIPESARISLKIYDMQGREIMTLLDEERPAGKYEIVLQPENLASGIYLCRLASGPFILTKKIILRR